MAIGDTLVFEGRRWPAAQITAATPMVLRTYPHDLDYRPPSRTIFKLGATGRGRRWSSTHPAGFWRDFAGLEIGKAESVVAFVRRRGDPEGLLDVGAETNTASWGNLSALLCTAARAWEPENADGVSRLTADEGRLREANYFLRGADLPVAKDLEAVPDPTGGPGFAFRARTLATFMLASAASGLERRVDMRRCDHCGAWLERIRRDTRFCSSSCRSLHSQQRDK
jgi:hypothetical protein